MQCLPLIDAERLPLMAVKVHARPSSAAASPAILVRVMIFRKFIASPSHHRPSAPGGLYYYDGPQRPNNILPVPQETSGEGLGPTAAA